MKALRWRAGWVISCVALVLAIGNAQCRAEAASQSYPAKAVRVVVPFSPGGSNDIMARLIGQKFTELLGQQFVIDSRRFAKHIRHAIGALERPMSDADLEQKFAELAAEAPSGFSPAQVIELAWTLDELQDAASLGRATVPKEAAVPAML